MVTGGMGMGEERKPTMADWHAMSAPPTTAFSLPASVRGNHGRCSDAGQMEAEEVTARTTAIIKPHDGVLAKKPAVQYPCRSGEGSATPAKTVNGGMGRIQRGNNR